MGRKGRRFQTALLILLAGGCSGPVSPPPSPSPDGRFQFRLGRESIGGEVRATLTVMDAGGMQVGHVVTPLVTRDDEAGIVYAAWDGSDRIVAHRKHPRPDERPFEVQRDGDGTWKGRSVDGGSP